MLKDYLTSKNISFSEKLVDMDESAKTEMAGLSNGFLGVPFIVITDDSGNKNTIVGFDKGKINQIISQ
jgi:glutaredoxin